MPARAKAALLIGRRPLTVLGAGLPSAEPVESSGKRSQTTSRGSCFLSYFDSQQLQPFVSQLFFFVRSCRVAGQYCMMRVCRCCGRQHSPICTRCVLGSPRKSSWSREGCMKLLARLESGEQADNSHGAAHTVEASRSLHTFVHGLSASLTMSRFIGAQ